MVELKMTIRFRRSPASVVNAIIEKHNVLLSPELLTLLTEANRDPVAIVSDVLSRLGHKPLVLTVRDLGVIL